jgi:hypothetical protein
MRFPRAGRSGGSAVRAKTKRGGALVDVDGVVPFQDFSNPIDMLVGNPDGHHRRAAFETAVIDGVSWSGSPPNRLLQNPCPAGLPLEPGVPDAARLPAWRVIAVGGTWAASRSRTAASA